MNEEKCAQCGTPATPSAKFCESCGAPLTAASQPVQGPVVAAPAPSYAIPGAQVTVPGRRHPLCRDTHRYNNHIDHIYNTDLASVIVYCEYYNCDSDVWRSVICGSSDRSHHLTTLLHTASRALWAERGNDDSQDKSSQRGRLLSDQLWRSGNPYDFVADRCHSVCDPIPAWRNPYLDLRQETAPR